ncbi:MAG: hypothetical protein O2820_11490 [Planctomycetota bacterium]|nr:hypothetical protein [Planctomycetota bacterium]MDA1249832.1 hypothetical protein [Planctomycetota bacterium]
MTQQKSNWLCLFVAAGLAFSLAGCGGSSEDSSEGDGASSSSGKGGDERSASTGGSSKKGNDDRPNVDGIPINVFFPEPLAVAAESGEVVAATTPNGEVPGANPVAPPETVETPEEPKPAAGGAVAWNEVITVDVLKDELKSIRLLLQQRLSTLASYNSSYLEIPIFATTMSLMAEVARRHPDDVSWKKNAKYIRDLGVSMVAVCSSSDARGRKSYDEVNGAFLKICSILDNNMPAELPEAEEDSDFLSSADMGYLMKRLERGMQWMQNNAGSEDAFKENVAMAKREVGVFAAIAQAFADESYGYSDDEEFTGHAFEMRDASSQMSKAADGNDFGTFDELRSKVDQKCTQCHMTFRTG